MIKCPKCGAAISDHQLNEKVATKYADYETAMSEMSISIDSLKNQLSN